MPKPGEDPTLLNLALAYAERGWRVFPLATGKKTPRFPKGHRFGDGCHSATTDPATIREMWRVGGYQCNVGIATGRESGLFVLDFDNKGDGPQANDTALREALGLFEWPTSYLVLTPSGGWHRYYECPPEADQLGSGREVIGPGVDHRGHGGYVVAAGSVVDGQEYEAIGDIGEELAELPAGVVDLIMANKAKDRERHAEPSSGPVGAPASFSELWAEVGIILRSGDRLYSCPFHDDHHPSLRINAGTERWLCFACHRQGGYRALWRLVRPEESVPGGGSGLSAADERVLSACEAVLQDPSKAASELKAFQVIVRAARQKGSLVLGIAQRWLAEEAGFRASAAGDVIRRLIADGLLERTDLMPGESRAYGYRICDPLTWTLTENAESSDARGERDVSSGFPAPDLSIRDLGSRGYLPPAHDALRAHSLGSALKTATHLSQVKKDSITGIQHAIGAGSVRTAYRHVEKLKEANLVIKEGDLYRWVEPDSSTLDEYAQLRGTAGKGAQQKIEHEIEREGYLLYQERLRERMLTSRRISQDRATHRVADYVTGQPITTYTQDEARRMGIIDVDASTGEIVGHRRNLSVAALRDSPPEESMAVSRPGRKSAPSRKAKKRRNRTRPLDDEPRLPAPAPKLHSWASATSSPKAPPTLRDDDRPIPRSIFDRDLDLVCPNPPTISYYSPYLREEIVEVLDTRWDSRTCRLVPNRCQRTGCVACGVLKAKGVAYALWLSRLDFMLTLEMVGPDNENVRQTIRKFVADMRGLGPSFRSAHVVEANLDGEGCQVRFFIHTSAFLSRSLKYFEELIREVWSGPYELVRVFPDPWVKWFGHYMDWIIDPELREVTLALNRRGNQPGLIHADRGFWRDGREGPKMTRDQAAKLGRERRREELRT